nr:hypothetical protein [Myxococcus sp. AB036A]
MVTLQPVLPALNRTMQATFLTGNYPSIVADGWLQPTANMTTAASWESSMRPHRHGKRGRRPTLLPE